MRITSADALAMALGAVAVVFSGFVLAHSAWGGVAVLVGGALALSIVPLRGRLPAAAPVVWVAFLVLLSVGVAGFLVGFGVFDSPDIEHDTEATLHDAPGDDATVLVTGTVRNEGDGPAAAVSVDVTLSDGDGRTIDTADVRLDAVGAGTSQQFFVRFGPDPALSDFESFEIDLSVET